MGIHIAYDSRHDIALLYCSTSDWAFGPTFGNSDDHDADERAESFLRWLETCDEWPTFDKVGLGGRRDARELSDSGLQSAYGAWLVQEEDQWKREDAAELERLGAD